VVDSWWSECYDLGDVRLFVARTEPAIATAEKVADIIRFIVTVPPLLRLLHTA
jgi:hypothetical protein